MEYINKNFIFFLCLKNSKYIHTNNCHLNNVLLLIKALALGYNAEYCCKLFST